MFIKKNENAGTNATQKELARQKEVYLGSPDCSCKGMWITWELPHDPQFPNQTDSNVHSHSIHHYYSNLFTSCWIFGASS